MQFNVTLSKAWQLLTKTVMAIVLLCFATGTGVAQTYTNGNLTTGATTSNGTAAPAGYTWSEVQNPNGTAGYAASVEAGYSVADDFTVPAGQTWYTTTFRVYGYSTGYTGTTSPFDEARIALYSSNPSSGSPAPLFGDMTTNRIVGSGEATMYRIFNATPGTTRKIWYVDIQLSTALPAGTYWIEYQIGTAGNITSFMPPSTVVGQPTQAGNNAQQHALAGNTWIGLNDAGGAQDMPFTVNYTTTCTAAGTPAPTASPVQSCSGTPVTLTANGALNNSANWKWYTGSCGGTLVGTGATITVSPTATTTYYVRGEGNCPGNGACGEVTVTVTPCLCLSPDLVTICEGQIQKLSLTIPPGGVQAFTSAGGATIPSSGTATPYPAVLNVSGLPTTGTVVKNVKLNGISHTWPSDLDIVLVSPTGTSVILMSDVGGSTDIVNATLTLQDGSPALASPIVTGTYKPTNSGTPDTWPAPGPGSISQANPLLSSFTGDMNGDWKLYIVDQFAGDQGSVTSFTITFENLPTATWTGGTIFTDPAATIPYVAGTPATTVYVQPSATTTYTATISGSTAACNGPNQVTVTVLPRPVLSVTPTSGCAPVTFTASGATTYAWTPSAGLSATTGSTVTANPTASTVYSVVGTGTNGCKSAPVSVTANAKSTAATITTLPTFNYYLQEGFNAAPFPPATWSWKNNSSPLGATNWLQGSAGGVFPPQEGSDFIAANFNNTAGAGTISNWLMTPVVNLVNGNKFSFWVRGTGSAWPDRLQIRMSMAGASVNVGTTATSVGDFTVLLQDINPTYSTTGFPSTWTKYTITLNNSSLPVQGLQGRFAFRYFVEDGGPTGNNSDYFGIDNVAYFSEQLFNCANTVSNIGVNITGGVSPFTVVYSNGTTNTTINNYQSGSPIQVSPAVTTTYTIVSVTSANGCVGTGNSGSAIVKVTAPTSIITQPKDTTIQCGGTAKFTLITTGGATLYQWQMRTSATAAWTNVVNGGVYSGANDSVLVLTNLPESPYNGYQFRVFYVPACKTGVDTSAVAKLTVAPLVAVVSPASSTICQGSIQKLMITNINSPAPATSTYTSGPITLNIPDNTTTGVTNAITVPAIVGSGQLLSVKVKVNMTHTWTGDVVLALKAPGGQIANLDWFLSGTGSAGGGLGFVNTTFSSDLSNPFVGAGTAPYSGTYRFDNVGNTANPVGAPTSLGTAANVVGIANLISATANPAGTWTLGAYDGGGGDVGTITSWSLELTYMLGAPSTGVWGPAAAIGTIFTDAGATVPYVANTPVNTVYVKPTANTTYTVVVTTPTPCTSSVTSIPITVNTPLSGSATVADKLVCVGGNTKFFLATTPTGYANGVKHQWQVNTGSTWTNLANAGVYAGVTTDTLRITGATSTMNGYKYRDSLSNACSPYVLSSAGTLTVDNPSTTITSTGTTVIPGQTVTLTAAPSSGTGSVYVWNYNGALLTGVTGPTVTVGVDNAGTYTATVTNSNGCTTAASASFTVGFAESTNLWIYPSPNTGKFQVRYYNQSPNTPRYLVIYDSKGARVWYSRYVVGVGYTRMDVDITKFGKGTYAVELSDMNGDRIKVGRVLVL